MRRLAVLLTLLAPILSARAKPTTQPAPWKSLFNGKDLTGWYPYLLGQGKDNDPTHVFTVESYSIHLYKNAKDGSPQPIGFLSSVEEFGDCRIRLEYKWGTKQFGSYAGKHRDAGLLYFVTGADGAFSPGRPWPFCVEFQIQEGDTGDAFAVGTQATTTIDPATKTNKRPSFKDGGEAYTTPPTDNNRIVHSEMLEKEGWNSVELILEGDSATQIVNGKMNMRLTHVKSRASNAEELKPVRKGRILLQAEGSEVWYRCVEVQPLPGPP